MRSKAPTGRVNNNAFQSFPHGQSRWIIHTDNHLRLPPGQLWKAVRVGRQAVLSEHVVSIRVALCERRGVQQPCHSLVEHTVMM